MDPSMSAPAKKAVTLTLYVAGKAPKSVAAIANLERICGEHFAGHYQIDVIDLRQAPHLAREHDIIAIPTLARKLPAPIRKIIGDRSDTQKVLVHLAVGTE